MKIRRLLFRLSVFEIVKLQLAGRIHQWNLSRLDLKITAVTIAFRNYTPRMRNRSEVLPLYLYEPLSSILRCNLACICYLQTKHKRYICHWMYFISVTSTLISSIECMECVECWLPRTSVEGIFQNRSKIKKNSNFECQDLNGSAKVPQKGPRADQVFWA